MEIMRTFALVSAAAIGLTFTGCKPDEDGNTAGVKTLDNFAAGQTVSVNSCKGSFKDTDLASRWENRINFGNDIKTKLSQEHQKRYRGIVKDYLSAVPTQVQKAFLDLGGEIMLTGLAADYCSRGFGDAQSDQYLADARQGMESCMIYSSGEKGSQWEGRAVLAVFHQINLPDAKGAGDDNEVRIRHGGVRVMGLTFGQFFSKLSSNDNTGELANGIKFKLNPVDNVSMSSIKNRMANHFLVDVVRKGTYDLKVLEPLLGAGSAAAIKNAVVDEKGMLRSRVIDSDVLANASFKYSVSENVSEGQKAVRRQRFVDFVFGEAFDSYYCSAATRKVMDADLDPDTYDGEFHLTFVDFKNLEGDILAQAAALSRVQSGGSANLTEATDNDGGDSLSLTNGNSAWNNFDLSALGGDGNYSRACTNCGTCCGGDCGCQGCSNCCNGTCNGGCCGGSCGGGNQVTANPQDAAKFAAGAQQFMPFFAAFLQKVI